MKDKPAQEGRRGAQRDDESRDGTPGIDPADVADLVVQGIKTDQFYLFPHPEMKDAAQQRVSELLDSFGEAIRSGSSAQQRFMSQLLPSTPQKS